MGWRARMRPSVSVSMAKHATMLLMWVWWNALRLRYLRRRSGVETFQESSPPPRLCLCLRPRPCPRPRRLFGKASPSIVRPVLLSSLILPCVVWVFDVVRCLVPSETLQQVLGKQSWSRETNSFRAGFLAGGGFARVLRVIMAAPADGDRDAMLGYASALRILKTCLSYPPLELAHGAGAVQGAPGVGNARTSGGGIALVAREPPPVEHPSEAERAAMDLKEDDLQQLLDKLVQVAAVCNRLQLLGFAYCRVCLRCGVEVILKSLNTRLA